MNSEQSLETLQPSFSCRVLNSPEERQRASGRTKQKEESETGKDRLFSVSSAPQVTFFPVRVRHVKTDQSVCFPDKYRLTYLRETPIQDIPPN